MKQIQIPEELFQHLVAYHLNFTKLDEYELDDLERQIQRGLTTKVDAIIRHQLYSAYKTAPTEAQQETARQQYLDAVGMSNSFRW